MVATTNGTDWAMLISVGDGERVRAMREYLETALAQSPADFDQSLEEMVEAEYGLDDASLRLFTISRLRAWGEIARENLEAAQRLARGYDAIFDRATADLAMRRAKIVQGVARTELTLEEVDALFAVIPSFLRQVPRLSPSLVANARPRRRASHWWRFWRRRLASPEGIANAEAQGS